MDGSEDSGDTKLNDRHHAFRVVLGDVINQRFRSRAGTDVSVIHAAMDEEEDEMEDRDEQLAAAEWALERECELTRLELENRVLRQLVAENEGATTTINEVKELPKLLSLPKAPVRTRKGQLGGRDVGPFGLYRKLEDS